MAEHRINKVHFIGIGGVGMSGIARVAKEKGMEVSGSDLRESRYTQQLRGRQDLYRSERIQSRRARSRRSGGFYCYSRKQR